jgi:hypothetical protein
MPAVDACPLAAGDPNLMIYQQASYFEGAGEHLVLSVPPVYRLRSGKRSGNKT